MLVVNLLLFKKHELMACRGIIFIFQKLGASETVSSATKAIQKGIWKHLIERFMPSCYFSLHHRSLYLVSMLYLGLLLIFYAINHFINQLAVTDFISHAY